MASATGPAEDGKKMRRRRESCSLKSLRQRGEAERRSFPDPGKPQLVRDLPGSESSLDWLKGEDWKEHYFSKEPKGIQSLEQPLSLGDEGKSVHRGGGAWVNCNPWFGETTTQEWGPRTQERVWTSA